VTVGQVAGVARQDAGTQGSRGVGGAVLVGLGPGTHGTHVAGVVGVSVGSGTPVIVGTGVGSQAGAVLVDEGLGGVVVVVVVVAGGVVVVDVVDVDAVDVDEGDAGTEVGEDFTGAVAVAFGCGAFGLAGLAWCRLAAALPAATGRAAGLEVRGARAAALAGARSEAGMALTPWR